LLADDYSWTSIHGSSAGPSASDGWRQVVQSGL